MSYTYLKTVSANLKFGDRHSTSVVILDGSCPRCLAGGFFFAGGFLAYRDERVISTLRMGVYGSWS